MKSDVKLTYKSARASVRDARTKANELLESIKILFTSSTELNIRKNASTLESEVKEYIKYLNGLKKTLKKKGYAKTIDEEYEYFMTMGKVDNGLVKLTGDFMRIMQEVSVGTEYENDFKGLQSQVDEVEEMFNDTTFCS